MMKIAIHQPQYLPYAGFFDKMDKADMFVLLDDVQFKKNEWQNRNRIPNSQGWQWLTVPVKYKFGQKICEIEINNKTNWMNKHYQALLTNYNQAPAFKDYQSFLKNVYGKKWERLSFLNVYLIENLKKFLGIETDLILSSELSVSGRKTGRLIEICRKLKADIYLSGPGGESYLDLDEFKKAGIELKFQNFHEPVSPQVFPEQGFQINMSIIDLLFNCGKESLKVLRKKQK